MAIKIAALKSAFVPRSASKAEERVASAAGPSWMARPLPLIGRLSSGRQMQILTILLVGLLLVDAGLGFYDTRQGSFATLYIATVGKIRMLSQRLAKAAQQASQGNREAFKQLRESRDEFAASVKLLASGGLAGGVDLPQTPDSVRPLLDTLDREWKKTERNAGFVITEERNLVALGEAVQLIQANNPAFVQLADENPAATGQTGGAERQNAVSAQRVVLTQ